MLGSNIEPPQPTKVKKLGLTGSASSEFAKRFMTKPTRQPKVIDFNAGNLQADKKRRGINGFFPPMKLRNSAKEPKTSSSGDIKINVETRTKEDRLQLVPTSYSEVRPRSNTSRAVSRASRRSVGLRKSPESARTIPANPSENYLPYADTFDCDDLSVLPPPKRILPRRDVPWVFRYKVKKNMNELSKILASKPQQAIENL